MSQSELTFEISESGRRRFLIAQYLNLEITANLADSYVNITRLTQLIFQRIGRETRLNRLFRNNTLWELLTGSDLLIDQDDFYTLYDRTISREYRGIYINPNVLTTVTRLISRRYTLKVQRFMDELYGRDLLVRIQQRVYSDYDDNVRTAEEEDIPIPVINRPHIPLGSSLIERVGDPFNGIPSTFTIISPPNQRRPDLDIATPVNVENDRSSNKRRE